MSVVEFHPLAEIFPLIEGYEFAGLVDDIRKNGLREPVVLYQGRILDGRNRLRACEAAGVACRFETYTGDDPVAYVVSLNLRRRHLDESQRAMVAAKLAALRLGDNQHSEGTSIEGASRLLNVGRASVERAKAVQREGAAELVSAVERGVVSVSAAADIATLSGEAQRDLLARCDDREVVNAASEIRARKAEARRAKRIAKLAEISNANSPIPSGRRYPIILADPPWRHEHPTFSLSRDIEEHYPTLSLEEICALPVGELAAETAMLFLWVPAPKLEEAFRVISAWGFEYRTGMVWVKHAIGLGNYVRQQHEHLLLARRGEIPTPEPANRPPSIIQAPRREHSRKPDEAYALIEAMYPELSKIELFARQTRPGWAAWGNEISRAAAE